MYGLTLYLQSMLFSSIWFFLVKPGTSKLLLWTQSCNHVIFSWFGLSKEILQWPSKISGWIPRRVVMAWDARGISRWVPSWMPRDNTTGRGVVKRRKGLSINYVTFLGRGGSQKVNKSDGGKGVSQKVTNSSKELTNTIKEGVQVKERPEVIGWPKVNGKGGGGSDSFLSQK